MSKTSTTVRDVFELPAPGADGSGNWKTFQEKVRKEVKGIKTAALPDMAEKVAELFDIPLPNIFLSSWRKANKIQALLDESRTAPETVMNAELGDHTINSQHKPHIEIRIQDKAVKKLEFTLKLVFNLKGFVLKIQNGEIRGMQTGSCEVRGKMEYQGLVIAEKKIAPITLPGSVSFDDATARLKPEKVDEPPAPVPATLSESLDTSTEEVAATKAEIPEANLLVPAQTEEVSTSPPDVTAVDAAPSLSATPQEPTAPEIVQLPPAEAASKEVVEAKPDDVVLTANETSFPVVEQKVEPAPGVDRVPAAQQTTDAVEEVEERMTWEVGDEEDFVDSPAIPEEPALATEHEKSQSSESAEDAIARMSRELADRLHSSGTADKPNDQAQRQRREM